jgi:hypothetical protein
MDLTPKQQTSEAIRQAETILITTGQHPSVDQVAAVIGLSMILRKFGKKVSAILSDSLPQSVQLLETAVVERNLGGLRDFVLKLDVTRAQVGDLRAGEVANGKLPIIVTPSAGNFAPSDVTFDYGEASFSYDLAIVLGVPTRARIDRVYEQNQDLFAKIPMINLDFHRSNENYGAVNLIEPNASSLCEMLVALAESLQGGIIDDQIATALLMGIVASTDRFTASHTTSKSLTVAAQMMAAGARQQAVVRALYRDGKGSDSPRGERGGERDRNNSERTQNDRSQNDRTPREQQRPAQAQTQPQPQSQPQPQPQPAAQVQTSAPAQQPAAQQPSVYVPKEDPVVASSGDVPIIQPSHIELSEQDAGPRPDVASMADFSAAAEVLAPRSSDGEGNPPPTNTPTSF